MDRIRVLLVDDHTIVREGLRALLARRKDIEVIGEAGDGKEALAQVAALHPDVVLMDIEMPGTDGMTATEKIRQSFPETRVLILTQYENREYILPVLRAGAAGYLVKLTCAMELIDAIRAVHSKGAFLPPDVTHELVQGLAESAEDKKTSPTFTEREKQVIQLVAGGATSRAIADRLHISVRTVDTHRAHIMEKAGAHSTADLVMYALREGLVNL